METIEQLIMLIGSFYIGYLWKDGDKLLAAIMIGLCMIIFILDYSFILSFIIGIILSNVKLRFVRKED